MKQSLILKSRIAILVVLASTFFTSCIKDRDGQVDFSGLSPIAQIVEGGLQNYAKSALTFPATDLSDTAYFRLNYAATNVAPNDIVVTLAYDAAALAAYNAANPTGPQYQKMPDSIYSFTQTSVTIKAGQSYSDLVKFVVYPSKIDITKSYMFPISITNASGVTISGNFGTIYYHVIGNPLAGNYNVLFSRWNYTGQAAWAGPAAGLGLATSLDANHVAQPASNPPAATVAFYGETGVAGYPPTNFAPVTDHTVTGFIGNVPEPGASSGANYFITGDATFATISYDFAAIWYSNGPTAGYSNTARYVRGYIPPSPTQKPAFRLITQYNNALGGAGNDRIVDETFRHQ